MAHSEWRDKLNLNSFFASLAECLNETNAGKETKNILECVGDSIFVWDDFNQRVLTTNVDVAIRSSDSTVSSHQVLVCNKPPIHRVTKLLLNDRGNLLALIGLQGVTVLELPIRWGKYGKFEGGKEQILCKSYTISERFFVCSPKVKVLQARWFPETDSYITILTSDNYIRIYKVDDPESPVQTCSLADTEASLSTNTSTFNISLSLGEIAISFDFALPIENTSENDEEFYKYWPVFILKGNGDIYFVLLQAPVLDRFQKTTLHGPLLMHPAADDNYGVDSCSLLCLKCTPSVLVVASSSGTIYHSVVLENNAGSTEHNSSEVSVKTKGHIPNWSLYVIESIELELSLATSEYFEDIMCPIYLHHDPTTYTRYHCSHSAGIHTMALPFIHHLEQFGKTEDTTSFPNFLEKECIVEHLLCTKPLPSTPDFPVLGVSILLSHQLGLTLLCLTSQMKPIWLPLTNLFSKQPSFKALEEFAGESKVTDSTKTPFKESFKEHITNMLQRSSSNPMIRSSPDAEPSPKERLQLLTRATQVFREEYISRLDAAREEIERRVRVLHQQKDQQISDVKVNFKEQVVIKDKMGELGKMYNRILAKQKDLTKRSQNLLVVVQKNAPVLSDAERSLMKDYEDMNKKLKDYQNLLEKVKLTKGYQEMLPALDKNISISDASSPSSIDDARLKHLRAAIVKESEEINVSRNIIIALKKELSL